MATQHKTIDAGSAQAGASEVIVPEALASQQAQAASKARVDVGARASAFEESAKAVQPDATTYPGQAKGPTAQGSVSASEAPGGPGPPGFVASAVAAQQAQAAAKGRVDLGARAAMIQAGFSVTPPKTPARPGEIEQVAVGGLEARLTGMVLAQEPTVRATGSGKPRTSLLMEHLERVVRAASTPLPEVPPLPGVPTTGAVADPVEFPDGPDLRPEAPALPPPDSVAPASLQGSAPAGRPGRATIFPAGASAVGAASSLGLARPAHMRDEGGDRMSLRAEPDRAPTLARNLVDQEDASAMAADAARMAAEEADVSRRLGAEAGRLRREAAARRDGKANASAARLDERARELEGRAGRHALAAARAGDGQGRWIRRLEALRFEESDLARRLRGTEGAAGREAALVEAALVRRRAREAACRCERRPEGGAACR